MVQFIRAFLGSFTAIVNGLSNFVLKPIINWILALIFGANSLSDLYTMLKPAYVLDENGVATEVVDLANSIYIDWGSFINAIINFFLIALVLFSIVKIINKFRGEIQENFKSKISKEDKAEMKKLGIKLRDKQAVAAYFQEKENKAAESAEAAAKEAAEKARLEREANPTTEDLLKQILAEMKKA